MSLVVGTACGLAAVLLDFLVHFIRTHATGWIDSEHSFMYVILPGMGMLVSLLLVKYVVRDNIGHGVTKVLVAVSKNESKIRSHNMWSSILTSSITIGMGGSVGAEAPIVYTGAAIGSNVARWMGMGHKEVTILLGCGAAGAIAGIFKAPLAGILFTLEILLFNISMSSMIPLLLSTVSATVVSYIFTGMASPFACELTTFSMKNIPAYIALGVICSGFSLYFNKTTMWLEDKAKQVRNPYVKWAVCAACLGMLIYLFPPLYGEGYGVLQDLLLGRTPALEGQTPLAFFMSKPVLIPVFFTLIIFVKVFSMTFTNAGGGVGGTFGPTLFIGGMVGFVVSRSINLLPMADAYSVPEANFVLVGMAGLMAGVMQAPMTAIFLIAEISGGYELLIPLIITSTISYGIAHAVDPYSIYTKRIASKGELLTHDSDQAVLTLLKVSDFLESDFKAVNIDASLGEFVDAVAHSNRNIFPVIDSRKRFQGFVALDDIRSDMFKRELYNKVHVYNFMQSAPDYIYNTDSMQEVMDKFEKTGAWNLPVVTMDRTYLGFVSKSKIFTAYRSRLQEVSHD
ncbi:MAG: chloride channel protein [Bacteroidales bacterium]|nr:chloride channel protein [Bacteroidales bacterium]